MLTAAVLTGAAVTAAPATAHVHLPAALGRSMAVHRPPGSVFAPQPWLIGTCVVVAFPLTAGAVPAPVLPPSDGARPLE